MYTRIHCKKRREWVMLQYRPLGERVTVVIAGFLGLPGIGALALVQFFL